MARKTWLRLTAGEVYRMRLAYMTGQSVWAICREFRIGQDYTRKIVSGEIYPDGPWPRPGEQLGYIKTPEGWKPIGDRFFQSQGSP